MAEVELTEDALIIHVRGLDRIFALKSRLEIPHSHERYARLVIIGVDDPQATAAIEGAIGGG